MADKYLGIVRWKGRPSSTKFNFSGDDPSHACEQLRRLSGVTSLTELDGYQLLKITDFEGKAGYILIAEKSPSTSHALVPVVSAPKKIEDEKSYTPYLKAQAA